MEQNLVIIKTKQNENKQNENKRNENKQNENKQNENKQIEKKTKFSVKKKFKIGRFLVNILYEK